MNDQSEERQWVRDNLTSAEKPEDLSAWDFFQAMIGSRTDEELIVRIDNLCAMLIRERPLEGERGDVVMLDELKRVAEECSRRGDPLRKRAAERFAEWRPKISEHDRKTCGNSEGEADDR